MKNFFLYFSFVVCFFSVMGWGTKNSVDESSSVSLSDITNLVAEFEDHVNLVHETTDENFSKQESSSDLKLSEKLSILDEIVDPEKRQVVEQQLSEIKNKFRQKIVRILRSNRPYEQQLKETPILFQIAMNSYPIQVMNESFELGTFLTKKELIELRRPYKFYITNEFIKSNNHQGYCFKIITINDYLSQETAIAWDKSTHQYFVGCRMVYSEFANVTCDELTDLKLLEKILKLHVLEESNTIIALTVKFTKTRIFVTEIDIVKNEQKYQLDNQGFRSIEEFRTFLEELSCF